MKLTIKQALKQGVIAHKEGKLKDAEHLYRFILQSQPKHPDANHNLGLIAVSANKTLEALPLFKTALDASPKIDQFWLSYIDTLIKENQFDSARQSLKQAKRQGVSGGKLNTLEVHLSSINKKEEVNSLKPPDSAINNLLQQYQNGSYVDAEKLALSMTREFPKYQFGWKVLGALLKQTGRIIESLAPLKKSVQLSPKDPQAFNNLGTILKELDRLDEAEASYIQAIKLKPDYAEAHNNLGVTLKELGRLDDAEASYIQTIALQPEYFLAHNNLGNTLKELGRLDEAEASFKKAIALRPDFAEAHSNLGNILQELERLDEAEASYIQAITLQPDFAEVHNNLGVILKDLERLDEAEASYIQAIALQPDFAEVHNNLGVTLKELGRLDEAEASYIQAIALQPDYALAHNNLGVTLKELGRLDEALSSYTQAITLQPNLAEAHNNLGITFKELGRLDEAEASYTRAIELKPDYAEVHNNLGNTFKELGRLDEAEASYTKAIELKPDYVEARSNLLFLISGFRYEPSKYLNEAREFGQIISKPVLSRFSNWSCEEEPKNLRIGLVSGDLKNHPVGFFLEGLLNQLGDSKIELYAYTTRLNSDDLTLRIKPNFARWRSLVGISDDLAANYIHSDGIHILIDLSGHTAHNRLKIFARKPAPIQITWLGYFASTGVDEIDYILGDPYVTPAMEADHFSEKIWQLPESYLCFSEPQADINIGPLPALGNGRVTFGCFNKIARINDDVVSVWSKILHAVPDAILFLKDRNFQVKSVRESFYDRFKFNGIGKERLIFEGESPRSEYLEAYNRVDIALSPFPYGGGTTSAEGLWMGVPVITMQGNHFLSHLGESILHNTRLLDWIASDEEDYIAKAIAFSDDLESLVKLRSKLRAQVLSSPLSDAVSFANNFEEALREIWKTKGS